MFFTLILVHFKWQIMYEHAIKFGYTYSWFTAEVTSQGILNFKVKILQYNRGQNRTYLCYILCSECI